MDGVLQHLRTVIGEHLTELERVVLGLLDGLEQRVAQAANALWDELQEGRQELLTVLRGVSRRRQGVCQVFQRGTDDVSQFRQRQAQFLTHILLAEGRQQPTDKLKGLHIGSLDAGWGIKDDQERGLP
ncbi:hypothetical protein D3C87_1699870 [compost metagenome]